MATKNDHAKEHEPQPAAHPAAAAAAQPDPPVKTIVDEQRERSEEIQKVGVAAWVAAHDERTDDEKQQKPVAGVPNVKVEPPLRR